MVDLSISTIVDGVRVVVLLLIILNLDIAVVLRIVRGTFLRVVMMMYPEIEMVVEVEVEVGES